MNAVKNVLQCLKARLSAVGLWGQRNMRVASMFDYVSRIEMERISAYSVLDIRMAHVGTSQYNPRGNECSQYDRNADDELVTPESAAHFRLHVRTPASSRCINMLNNVKIRVKDLKPCRRLFTDCFSTMHLNPR